MAIKELQDAYNKITTGKLISNTPSDSPAPGNAQIKRDLDECKVAVKKLAESITTVKNVLDRKIQDEIRRVSYCPFAFENYHIVYSENKISRDLKLD